MKRKVKNTIKVIIGIIILLLLIYRAGINNLVDSISNLNIIYIIPLIIIYPTTILMGAINIKVLLNHYKNEIKIKKIIQYYLTSYTLGLFTPSNIGEFYIIKLLKKDGLETEKALTISLIDKLITIVTLALVSILGVLFIFNINKKVILIAILIIILVIFIISNKMRFILKFILKKYKDNIDKLYDTLTDYIKNGKKKIILNFVLSIIKWYITALGIKLLILGFGYNIPTLLVFVITCTARFISLIPITIDGIGIKESIAVILYSQFNVPNAPIISVYLIYLFINYFIAILFTSSKLAFKQKN